MRQAGAIAALVIAKWLPLAAAPAFAVMTLLTSVLDSGAPVALCSTGDFGLGGMAPMYLLMAAIHLGPWLNLISRARNVAGLGEKVVCLLEEAKYADGVVFGPKGDTGIAIIEGTAA